MPGVPDFKERKISFFRSVATNLDIEQEQSPDLEPVCPKFPCQLMMSARIERFAIITWCVRSTNPGLGFEPGHQIKDMDTGAEVRGRHVAGRFIGPCEFFKEDSNQKLEGWDEFLQEFLSSREKRRRS